MRYQYEKFLQLVISSARYVFPSIFINKFQFKVHAAMYIIMILSPILIDFNALTKEKIL